jgi:hypothetical protein
MTCWVIASSQTVSEFRILTLSQAMKIDANFVNGSLAA